MKQKKGRIKIIFCLICSLILLSGCVSKATYSDLENQHKELQSRNAELITENESLSAEIAALTTDNETLKAELDELKNGASNRLYNIKQLFESKDYEKTIELANELHKNFNGSPEDIEGQELMSKAQEAIDKEKQEKEETEQKAKEEAEKSSKEKARAIIHITKLKKSKPNSAGGVDLFIGFKNKSDKVIKYVYFSVIPYNAVGDVVSCEIRRDSIFKAQVTGPYEKGEGLNGDYDGYWDCAWYSYDIERIELSEITIEYMDGSFVALTGDDLEYVQY